MHREIDSGSAHGTASSHMMKSYLFPIPVLQYYMVLFFRSIIYFSAPWKSGPCLKIGNTEYHPILLVENIRIKYMSRLP